MPSSCQHGRVTGDDQAQAASMAYLGPPGTYGHQAALAFALALDPQVELVPSPNITEIYSSPASYLVMPLQNTIHGGVTETLDCLLLAQVSGAEGRRPEAAANCLAGPSRPSRRDRSLIASRPRIIAQMDLPIRHCLVAKRGVKIQDVRWVRSHEQALGQSSCFLAEHLPNAEQQTWPSTAGAALSLLEQETEGGLNPASGNDSGSARHGGGHGPGLNGDWSPDPGSESGLKSGPGAAICSKAVVALHPDKLEVLHEGTQSLSDNYTRFLLLSRDSGDPDRDRLPSSTNASFVSSYYAFVPSYLIEFARSHNILHVHSRPASSELRPSGSATRFPTRLLVEVESPRELQDEVQRGSGIVYLGTAHSIVLP